MLIMNTMIIFISNLENACLLVDSQKQIQKLQRFRARQKNQQFHLAVKVEGVGVRDPGFPRGGANH